MTARHARADAGETERRGGGGGVSRPRQLAARSSCRRCSASACFRLSPPPSGTQLSLRVVPSRSASSPPSHLSPSSRRHQAMTSLLQAAVTLSRSALRPSALLLRVAFAAADAQPRCALTSRSLPLAPAIALICVVARRSSACSLSQPSCRLTLDHAASLTPLTS